jgi:transposase InsO family protein
MSEDLQHSSQALFRFSVVSQVLARMRRGETRAEAVGHVTCSEQALFDGSSRRVSARSIYRWLAAFEKAGVGGLEPGGRRRASRSHVLSEELVAFLISEKVRDRHASIPEIVRRARERGILAPKERVSRSTLYRTAKRLGLSVARAKRAKDRDSRRFAYPHRMDMVLCDGKHFRAGAKRKKRVALFFLDDATRYVLHVVVGSSETAELFQRGLFECIQKHGFMSSLYLDRGPGFIAEDTVSVLARLDIGLVHGEAGYKEGRGKVERFNRTVKANVLRGLDGRPEVDASPGALELRLRHYTEKVYAHEPHEGLLDKTPWLRFSTDPKPLRFPKDRASLETKFEIWLERRVSSDHVVSVGSIHYEMPRGYAGRKVILRRRLLEGGRIAFLHEGKLVDIAPVDLASNARAKRARGAHDYQHDFGPVVDEGGGFDFPYSDHDDDFPDLEELPW